jgi:hypothetical protein
MIFDPGRVWSMLSSPYSLRAFYEQIIHFGLLCESLCVCKHVINSRGSASQSKSDLKTSLDYLAL